jgi:hypothetical protein
MHHRLDLDPHPEEVTGHLLTRHGELLALGGCEPRSRPTVALCGRQIDRSRPGEDRGGEQANGTRRASQKSDHDVLAPEIWS